MNRRCHIGIAQRQRALLDDDDSNDAREDRSRLPSVQVVEVSSADKLDAVDNTGDIWHEERM